MNSPLKRSNTAGMNAPTLSVIVANYNYAAYIGDCLDSILKQTYKDLEILICDDCSTDQSLAILKDYEEKHPSIVKVIANTTNQGVAQSRHWAILQAKGEYLTTIDSDDYYYEAEKLQREMVLVLGYKRATGKDVIVYSNIAQVKEDKTLIAIRGNSENLKEGRIINEILARSCMIPRDFVLKTEIYLAVGGFDTDIPIYEDWDLKIRLAEKFDFHYAGINGTAYRKHGSGLSAAPGPEHVKWMRKIYAKNVSLIDEDDRERVSGQFEEYILNLKSRC